MGLYTHTLYEVVELVVVLEAVPPDIRTDPFLLFLRRGLRRTLVPICLLLYRLIGLGLVESPWWMIWR